MKTMKALLVFLALALFGTSFTACSSDDEAGNGGGSVDMVNLNKVFPQGLPTAMGDIKSITLDEEGRVKQMVLQYGGTVTFDYHNVQARATSKTSNVTMTINDGDVYTFDMTLNAQGYVTACTETLTETYFEEEETSTETWQFGYNANGQLNYMKRSEGDNEVTHITYAGGDIVKVAMTSDEDDHLNQTISYTTSAQPTSIENKAGIMFFDACFGIDMDEMEYAYYAGLLGKATQHLPLQYVDEDEGSTTALYWTLNANGLPTHFSIEDSPYDACDFVWAE